MNDKAHPFIRWVGYIILFIAGTFLLLSVMNLRSVLYYHSQVSIYHFLFLMFIYCAMTGIGLLQLRRWAVLSLLLPAVALAVIVIYTSLAKGAHVPMPWALVNIAFVALLIGIPILMLRYWSQLRW
jgi:hypothetical protein